MCRIWTVHDFLSFINEREHIRLQKEAGWPEPWSTNPVLRDTRITNLDRNHDRGTKMLFEHVSGLDIFSTIFYSVMYRSAYSSKPFLNWLTNDWQSDIHRIKTESLPNFGRMAYQIYLKGDQSMADFLISTALPVVDQLYQKIQTWDEVSISYAAEEIAKDFRTLHGMRLIFLGSEIAKDLSTLYPERVNPNSPVPFNTGTFTFLNRIYRYKSHAYKVDRLMAETGLQVPSILEHSACEMGKVIERTEYYEKNQRFKKQWLRL